MSKRVQLVKYFPKEQLQESSENASRFFTWKTLANGQDVRNSIPFIHCNGSPVDELEQILQNFEILERHCNVSAINHHNRYDFHRKQFQPQSHALSTWDQNLAATLPFQNQRTNGSIRNSYRNFIDLLLGEQNAGNLQRSQIAKIKWSTCKRDGAMDNPVRFGGRIEALYRIADSMNTTGTFNQLAKSRIYFEMFPEDFHHYAKYKARADLLDDNGGGNNPQTIAQISAVFKECWELHAIENGKVRDKNGNYRSTGGGGNNGNGDDRNNGGNDRKRRRGNNNERYGRGGNNNNNDTDRRRKGGDYHGSRKCTLHANSSHNWDKCTLNPRNTVNGKFGFKGLPAMEAFLNRDGNMNKKEFEWFRRVTNAVRRDQGLPPLQGSSNSNSGPGGQQNYYQQQGHWTWSPNPQAYFAGPPSNPPQSGPSMAGPPAGPPPNFNQGTAGSVARGPGSYFMGNPPQPHSGPNQFGPPSNHGPNGHWSYHQS